MIKILMSLNFLNEIVDDIRKQDNKNISLSLEKLMQNLISFFWQLCEDTLQLHKKYSSTDPLDSNSNDYKNKLYSYFKNFILDEYMIKSANYDINKLIKKLIDLKPNLRPFYGIIYTNTKILLYTKKNYHLMTKNSHSDKNIGEIKNSFSGNNLSTINKNNNFSENDNSISIWDFNDSSQNLNKMNVSLNSNNLINNFCKSDSNKSAIVFGRKSDAFMFGNKNKILRQNRRFSSHRSNNDLNFDFDFDKLYKSEENRNIYFEEIKLKKDLLRIYFSSYCFCFLTKDEDFISLKKLYKYIYIDEIENIISLDENNYENFNVSNFNFASKIKNFISNNQYSRLFLKKDFVFFENNKYFKYSHKCIVNTLDIKVTKIQKFYFDNDKKILGFNTKTKLLFPSKKLMLQNIKIPNLKFYFCELITDKGAISGKIFIYENGILFRNLIISDPKFDLRNNRNNSNLDFCCSSLEYDCIYENKIIFIAFEEIKEIIKKTFCFNWSSQEIFLKNNKSYLFNFYTEKNNNTLFDIYKNKNLVTIEKPKEYFESSDFITQWKNGKINNYDYLLLLNKLCSRSYNDYNQYPIMPWIFLKNMEIRDFDVPISVQKDVQKCFYQKKLNEENFDKQDYYHTNHYSTAAYIYFYLMRINPFTNDMIKFQSNDFDVPDRQFSNMYKTLELCEDCGNNRELIPEIYNFPEVFINLNYNDLGRQKDKIRMHNVELKPYANNPVEFCYKLRNEINFSSNINKNINLWFDFIFGVNQWTDDPTKSKIRLFNEKTYAQNVNLKKIIAECKKDKKGNQEIFDTLKTYISFAINLGQTPLQIFSEVHPQKNLDINKNNNNNNNIYTSQDVISKSKEVSSIIYFNISSDKQNINCLLSDKSLEIYEITNQINNKNGILKKNKSNIKYEIIREIKPKGQFLLLKKTQKNKLMYKPHFIFCELRQDVFIFCRYLDNTIKIFNAIVPKQKLKTDFSYLLSSFITSIIRINDNEFVTGDILGNIVKWKFKNNLEFISKIKSNSNGITCINYNEKIGILTICDNNNLVIRKYYDFEFLTFIKIKNTIVEVKISEFDLIYVLTYAIDKNVYELYCYSLNGIFVCKRQGNFTNFQFTKCGNIIIADIDDNAIHILNACDLNLIYSKNLAIDKNDKIFHFIFEENNIIYLGIENEKISKIRLINIEPHEESLFC